MTKATQLELGLETTSITLYHGTSDAFEGFPVARTDRATGIHAVFMTDCEWDAWSYAHGGAFSSRANGERPRIYKAYIDLTSLLDITHLDRDEDADEIDRLVYESTESVIHKPGDTSDGTEWCVFYDSAIQWVEEILDDEHDYGDDDDVDILDW